MFCFGRLQEKRQFEEMIETTAGWELFSLKAAKFLKPELSWEQIQVLRLFLGRSLRSGKESAACFDWRA